MTRFGIEINGHAVGIIMKEMVRRAIEAIWLERTIFTVEDKDSGYKTGIDFVTSADQKAQAIYVRLIRECFPGFGIVAEENELAEQCTLAGVNAYFVIDPLDGTKAYIRRQSWGIGTMIALIVDGEVVAAYVGDVMSREIYGFRPDSDKVHRITAYDQAEQLKVDTRRTLASQYALLLRSPYSFSGYVQQMLNDTDGPALFHSFEVSGGSIGSAMARLWKGEVGAIITPPYPQTPWDFGPILGISQRLGCVFLEIRPDRLVLTDPQPATVIQPQPHELMVLHRSRLDELMSWHMSL